VHYRLILGDGFKTLAEARRFFEVTQGQKGPQAVNVNKVIAGAGVARNALRRTRLRFTLVVSTM
jgi:hypothetical protein